MANRPAQWSVEHAARFQDADVAAAYHLRLPYPDEIYRFLLELLPAAPRSALDIGTGTGELARFLASHLERVDAIDVSAAMLARARIMEGGDRPNLRWMDGTAEEASLEPPYGIVTAGESIHWMDWDVVLARLADALAPSGYLAIVYRNEVGLPWQKEVDEIIQRFTLMKKFERFDLIAELQRRGLYEPVGRLEVSRYRRQSVEDYVGSFHSRSSFSRNHMGAAVAREFDEAVWTVVEPHAEQRILTLHSAARVDWGRPLTSRGTRGNGRPQNGRVS